MRNSGTAGCGQADAETRRRTATIRSGRPTHGHGTGSRSDRVFPEEAPLRKSKTTVIAIETERTLVIRQRGSSTIVWCRACCENVQMVTPAAAAIRVAAITRTIYRRVESGTLHFIETGDGSLLVCGNSLLESAGTRTGA
jgi:hypothetical protein